MILRLKNVVSGYEGSEVLHGVSIEVPREQIVSILGPNGAGKTTLLKTVMGILKPTSGQIIFEDNDVTSNSPRKNLQRGITYVPQGKSLYPWMTVEDNIKAGAYILRSRTLVEERIARVFELFPRLYERRSAYAGVLSGGERQMLAIGRALMLQPKLMMLDEPSLGLDPKFLSAVYQKVRDLNKSGTTILLVEQNVKKALEVSNFAYVLEGGEMKLSGTPELLSSQEAIRNVYLGGGVAG
jgi:branched-chain amino acid transport system ATP-binding protein